MTKSQPTVAIVTGGSGGIGSSICRRLANDGMQVVVHYGQDKPSAQTVVDKITAAGGHAVAIKANASKSTEIERLFDEAAAAFGAIDVLVANAGLNAGASIAETSDTEFERVFALNAHGAFATLRCAANRVRDNGRIINISSALTRRPAPGASVYAASKAATEVLARVLAEEVGPRGITVNSVLPGATIPGMFDNAPAEEQEKVQQASYFNRIGTADDVAAVVAFLASDDAGWVTGQSIAADGGAST